MCGVIRVELNNSNSPFVLWTPYYLPRVMMAQTENKEELAKEQWWRVILHNDEIHTFDYVTSSIIKASQPYHFFLASNLIPI